MQSMPKMASIYYSAIAVVVLGAPEMPNLQCTSKEGRLPKASLWDVDSQLLFGGNIP
jgi:hypothetical protein